MKTSCEKKPFLLRALFFVFLFVSCSRLPDFGHPHIFQGDDTLPLQVISYRNLTVADFQATQLPDYIQKHGNKLNAHTAITIRAVPGAKFTFSNVNTDAQQKYLGHIENLSYEAVMIPEQSWWNQTLAKEKEEHVLQHEQIHFALMEVAARQLTRRIAKEQKRQKVYDSSNESARKRLLDLIAQWFAESQKDVLREHTKFDQDTSQLYAPTIQQWWYERVTTELKTSTNAD